MIRLPAFAVLLSIPSTALSALKDEADREDRPTPPSFVPTPL